MSVASLEECDTSRELWASQKSGLLRPAQQKLSVAEAL